MPTKANKLKGGKERKRVKEVNTRGPTGLTASPDKPELLGFADLAQSHRWLVPLGFSWPTAIDNEFLNGDDLTFIIGPAHRKIILLI